MLPTLALLLCTCFVLYLLRLDRRVAPSVSTATWIPTVWFLSVASKPIGVWLGLEAAGVDEGSFWQRVFEVTLLILGVLVIGARGAKWWNLQAGYPWLAILIAYMLVSVSWSAVPYISFKRWVRQLIAIVMALLVSSERRPEEALESVFRRKVYVLIPFSLLLIKYFPNLGRHYGRWTGELMWIGVGTQKNQLARLCMFSSFFLIWQFFKRRDINTADSMRMHSFAEWALLGLSVYLFMGPNRILSYSATSLVTLGMGVLILFVLLSPKTHTASSRYMFGCILLCLIVYGTVTPFVGQLAIFDISSVVNRDEHLTGRSEIWEMVLPFAMQRPLFGFGIGGFWLDERRSAIASDSHNGYLDILIDFGFVGLVLVSIFVLSCFWRTHKRLGQSFHWSAFVTSFSFMLAVHNISETSLVWLASPMTSVLIFSLFVLQQEQDSERAQRVDTLSRDLVRG
jgi:exopolysaccharide production protein ExoQ